MYILLVNIIRFLLPETVTICMINYFVCKNKKIPLLITFYIFNFFRKLFEVCEIGQSKTITRKFQRWKS